MQAFPARATFLAGLLLAMMVAGCADNQPSDDPAEPADTPLVLPEGVQVFSDGAAVVPPSVLGTPRFFPTGYASGEPNMGVTSSGAIFASAGSNIVRSRDNGVSWEVVHTHLLLNSDPMMWVDPWTDCIYNAPMFPTLLGATIYESCDDGDTWPPLHSQNVGHGVYDHQKFASFPPPSDTLVPFDVVHETVFIICYNALAYTGCAMSYDGGRTWPIDQPIWNTVSQPSCAGQQSHPTGSDDGVVVVAKAWGCADPLVFVSHDAGVTWEMFEGPQGIGGDTLDPEIAFTKDGTMYMLWQSQRGQDYAYLARSGDFGATWDGVWNVTPPNVGSSVFASLHAGTRGRVAMAFHATNYTVYPSDAPLDARWYTYVVTSEDADATNPTFTSYRVQPLNDPVQIGGICNGNQGCTDGNRNLLDFIDGGIGPDGTFYTIIADGCGEGCAGDPKADDQASRREDVHLVRLDGWSLYDPADLAAT